MHDLDRTMGRTHMETEFLEFQNEGESEFQGEGEKEIFHEDELNELASEMLGISNEQELEQFLGGLVKTVGSLAGKAINSPIGRQLGGALKGVAKRALPVAGRALGNWIAPGIGGQIGSQVASAAGSMFGLELEGLSLEDSEFELAKQFVRFAADAANSALNAPAGADPKSVATQAITQAAHKYAPGILAHAGLSNGHGRATSPGAAAGASGRWVRKGNQIVLYGA
ncbi:hypothetical protein LZC95_22785 [Pendulispora brunnea]|uniref:Uncharacterized protein n=1 Tax=Pendulispora brunnea TaxID=2905690 RepID=A0ABZ2KM88_9BACT